MSLADLELNHPVEAMRLTLTYEGPLHAASAGNTRNSEKHEIRRVFHRQLRDVWYDLPLKDSIGRYRTLTREEREKILHAVGPYTFLPLVSRRLYAVAELDVLFLRREPAGGIVNNAGDIDNRIKVLFDALRMPLDANEIPVDAQPTADEDVMCCLLEDDSLITAFRLESERLLGPLEPDRESNVKLVIRVSIKLQRLTYENLGLGDMS
ncbi:MAG: hypothetical protein ACLQDV_02835 [Candidatus Binataceae bacterium]